MARDHSAALLFPGEGSQTPDMREQVDRHRPDLLELARSEVSDDLFERAGESTGNAPDQLVLSGAIPALDDAERLLGERKVHAKRLPVAGAFHSPGVETDAPLATEVAGV